MNANLQLWRQLAVEVLKLKDGWSTSYRDTSITFDWRRNEKRKIAIWLDVEVKAGLVLRKRAR